MRNALAAVALVLAFALGAGLVWHTTHQPAPMPDAPALILKVREVARLETLDVSLYKKIDFAPDPKAQPTVWSSLSQWATYSVRPPHGKAIVFAEAHLGLDLRQLDERSLRVTGRRVEIVLPRVETQVELRPGETEVIGSNLDARETAELFEKARVAFLGQVELDKGLQERARSAAQQSLRSLFTGLGFTEIVFVPRLSPRACARLKPRGPPRPARLRCFRCATAPACPRPSRRSGRWTRKSTS